MDPRDLKAASKYVNNLLASRGLLRGKEIAFHKPAEDDTTPSKIINLVHELLSRRDKEEEQRESLALTIRTLRSTETAQAATITQLKTKTADLERKNALLESAQRNFTSTLRTAETATRTLKDEVVRIKTTLSQVRTQCANDIRKRDVQIQKMKERLSDTRGRGTRPPMAQCTVIGGPSNLASSLASSRGGTTVVEDESSTLAQDTTDFLTKLSQDLADENDNLIALARTTLSTLKAIQGLPDDDHFLPAEVELDGDEGANPVIAPPVSFENLTAELDNVMYSLKEVLNQPNYVPLEELAERDAEIERLVAKNTTLEEEWRKAIELVDVWNKTLGAKFAEVTKEGEGVGGKSPSRTPGRGRTLVDIVHEGDAEETEEDEGVVAMGWKERRGGNDLSIVEEEVEQEEEGEDIMAIIRRSPTKEINREPLISETISEPQPTSAKRKGKQNAKATNNDVSTRVEEARIEEAAVEEQILAEVQATPAKTPAKKDKRKVRISEAAPEMFEPEVIATEAEETQEENMHEVRKTPVRKETKRKAKKDTHPEPLHEDTPETGITKEEEPAEKPRTSLAESDKKADKKGGNPETTHEVIQEVVTAQDEEPIPQIQALSTKKGRKRKAPKDVVEMIEETSIYDSTIMTEAPRGRERKRRARKEDAVGGAGTSRMVQDQEILPEVQPVEAPRGRKARMEGVAVEIGTSGKTDSAKRVQDEILFEIQPEESLVLKKKERKRRASKVRTDMDEILEQALSVVEPVELVEGKHEPPKGKERKRRASKVKEDESMAEDTFAAIVMRDGSMTVDIQHKEVPPQDGRKSRRSRLKTKKDLDDDSAMIDELAMEPVPVRYEEIANKVQVIGVKDEEEVGEGKPSRARRRSLRNRDKNPIASRVAPDPSPKKSSVQKRMPRASRKRGSSFTADGLDSFISIV